MEGALVFNRRFLGTTLLKACTSLWLCSSVLGENVQIIVLNESTMPKRCSSSSATRTE